MIRLLPPDEARKIAAGEVIDRPAAMVREFMDNAIDSGAALVEVSIEGGGAAKTEVSDDGEGMSRGDLELCWLTHATSKICSLEDLKTAGTLGFRGEALAAAASVSKLEILSSRDGREAWKLEVGPGEQYPPRLEQGRRTRGTSVRSLGLFDTIPARKRFLKQEGSEARLCGSVFNDKAMAFPDIAFRFFQDGKLKRFLPPAASLRERFIDIYFPKGETPPDESIPGGLVHHGTLRGGESFVHEITVSAQGFSAVIVAGGPELYRPDRRLQFIFANGRRIQDYSLIQAFEYGVQGWFPNGTHPLGAVFIKIDPALADFNIHPAKKEVRFADAGAIHHAVSSALRNFSRDVLRRSVERGEVFQAGVPEGGSGKDNAKDSLAFEALGTGERLPPYGHESANENTNDELPEETRPGALKPLRYLGRIFGLFIMVEKDDRLYIIDQHAAHERILYNRFIAGSIPKQELLVAIPFDTESSEDDAFLKARQEELSELGIAIREEGGSWLIEALPAEWRLGDRETVQSILDLKNSSGNMAEHWASALSCHRAVKEGDYLDRDTALALAEEALNLPVRRCPHGRPICIELSREELFKAVRRL